VVGGWWLVVGIVGLRNSLALLGYPAARTNGTNGTNGTNTSNDLKDSFGPFS
jgi:hypothetical protein